MSMSKDDRGRIAGIVLAVALVAAAAGGGIYRTMLPPPAPPPAAPAPATPAPAAAAPAAAAPVAPSVAEDCVFPGPAPVLPRGAVATVEDMKTQHDAVQGFINALEAYQVCYNQKIQNAPPGTEESVKQGWIAKGNRAIDEANALKDAFAQQLAIFKARQPETPPGK